MYKKPQAKAIAIPYSNPLSAAVLSFKNMAKLLADFMYGTPARLRLTYSFAFALAILGGALYGNADHIIASCVG